MMKSALSGIKVLDFCNFESGPTCTEDLAFLGADVYRIDRLKKGDKPRATSIGSDVMFSAMNMSKKSISLNMKSPEGQDIIWKLIDKMDVIVENMGPGSMDRLGFTWEAVHARNPRTIMVSIKGFGKGSPWEHYPAFDPCSQAISGAMYFNGPEDGEPMLVGPDIADYSAGHVTAIAICAALYQREKTGEGQFLEGSMQDILTCCLRGSFEPWYATGGHYNRPGNGMRLEHVAPHNVYKCKGNGECDYVMLYCSRLKTSSNFADLMNLIGHPEYIDDPRMETAQSRYLYRDELDKAIGEWTIQYDKYEAMEKIAGVGVPCSAVLDLGEVIDNPFLRKRKTIVDVNTEISGVKSLPTFGVQMSASEFNIFDPPRMGQHTKEVLKDLVALSDDEIKALEDAQVLYCE